eukprot:351281-Chlamydomonas_euryale.AAC.12
MPEELKPSIVKFRAWQIGMAVFIIGNVLNFASFAFAAQSLLAALGSVQFVANVVFASLVLKEKPSPPSHAIAASPPRPPPLCPPPSHNTSTSSCLSLQVAAFVSLDLAEKLQAGREGKSVG